MSESQPRREFLKGGILERLEAESDAKRLRKAEEEGFKTLRAYDDYHNGRPEFLYEVLQKEGKLDDFFIDDPEVNPNAWYNPKKCTCKGNLRTAPGSMTEEVDQLGSDPYEEMMIRLRKPSKRVAHDDVHHLWKKQDLEDELNLTMPDWADEDNIARHLMGKPPIRTRQEKLQAQPNPLKRLHDTLAVEREDDESHKLSRPEKRARHTAIHHTLPPQRLAELHETPARYPGPLKRVRSGLADEDEDENEGPNAKRVRRMVAHNNATLQRHKEGRAGKRLRGSPMKGSSGCSRPATPERHQARSPQPSAETPQQTATRSNLEPEIDTSAISPSSHTGGVDRVPGDVEAQIKAMEAKKARALARQSLEVLRHEEARGFPIVQEPQNHERNPVCTESLKRGRECQREEEEHDSVGPYASPGKKLRRMAVSCSSTAVPRTGASSSPGESLQRMDVPGSYTAFPKAGTSSSPGEALRQIEVPGSGTAFSTAGASASSGELLQRMDVLGSSTAFPKAGASTPPGETLRRIEVPGTSTAVPGTEVDAAAAATPMGPSATQESNVENHANVEANATALSTDAVAAGPTAGVDTEAAVGPTTQETNRARGVTKGRGRSRKNPPAGVQSRAQERGPVTTTTRTSRAKSRPATVNSRWLRSVLDNSRQTRSQKPTVLVELDAQSQVIPVRRPRQSTRPKAAMAPITRSSRAK
ncbi:MAG: hypothetical protein Q9226_005924 [Calogaya cf. arnoldii]